MTAAATDGIRAEEVSASLKGGLILQGIRYTRAGVVDDVAIDYGRDPLLSSTRGADYGGGRWLLLHGWLDNAASFDRFVPCLFEASGAEAVSEVVALDMSGHGRSGHKRGPYHAVDFACEALQAADLLFGSNARFNLLGHSLGGGVALLAAGTAAPGRVERLVMIESFGVHTAPTEEAPGILARALAKLPSGSAPSVFGSAAEAAARRAAKNVVPDRCFTAEHALVLCRRGLVPALSPVAPTKEVPAGDRGGGGDGSGGCGVTWSSDPWLLAPTRLLLDECAVTAFARRAATPTLVVVARDGMLQPYFRGPLGRLRPWTLAGSTAVWALACGLSLYRRYLLAATGISSSHARIAGSEANGGSKRSSALEQCERNLHGLRYVAPLRQRLRALRSGISVSGGARPAVTAHVAELPSGGHHPHLTAPRGVAAEVASWARKTQNRESPRYTKGSRDS